MKQKDSFALSPTNAKRVAVLFVTYGLLLIVSACYYYVVSGDRRFPIAYLFQVAVVGVCAWSINTRRKWAPLVGGVFAAWYVYYGVSSMIGLLNAGGINAPMPIQVIMWLLALRTVLIIVILSLLLFYTAYGQGDNR